MSTKSRSGQLRKFLILQTGSLPDIGGDTKAPFDSMAGLFLPPLDFTPEQVEIARLPENYFPAGCPRDYSGILITGSPLMVSAREDWMIRIRPWLVRARADAVPLLGVCFGHQLLAEAFGGRVGKNPNGLEAGTVAVTFSNDRAGDPLFSILPDHTSVQVHHYESVLAPPAGAEIFGRNARESCHAVRYGPAAWGVQFHPEITAPLMRDLLNGEALSLKREGIDSTLLIDNIRDTPSGPALLKRFRKIAESPRPPSSISGMDTE